MRRRLFILGVLASSAACTRRDDRVSAVIYGPGATSQVPASVADEAADYLAPVRNFCVGPPEECAQTAGGSGATGRVEQRGNHVSSSSAFEAWSSAGDRSGRKVKLPRASRARITRRRGYVRPGW